MFSNILAIQLQIAYQKQHSNTGSSRSLLVDFDYAYQFHWEVISIVICLNACQTAPKVRLAGSSCVFCVLSCFVHYFPAYHSQQYNTAATGTTVAMNHDEKKNIETPKSPTVQHKSVGPQHKEQYQPSQRHVKVTLLTLTNELPLPLPPPR